MTGPGGMARVWEVWWAELGTPAPRGVSIAPVGFRRAGLVRLPDPPGWDYLVPVDGPTRMPARELRVEWLSCEDEFARMFDGLRCPLVSLLLEPLTSDVIALRVSVPTAALRWDYDVGRGAGRVDMVPDDSGSFAEFRFEERPARDPGVYRCAVCDRPSAHPRDRAEGYCGACRTWTGDPILAAQVLTDAYQRARAGEVEVPAYTVGTGDEGEFVVHLPPSASALVRNLIAGDVARRFVQSQPGADAFEGMRR